ncbi:MAG TPA: hypothetical protein VG735_03400 [Caulobacterales bacterium]|nr:hypothetical protein [Caulobacterales bacterium]
MPKTTGPRSPFPNKRVLIAYSASSTHVQTTVDFLLSFSRHFEGDVSFVHVTHGAVMDFDLDVFDVVIHSYCARLPYEGYVSPHYEAALSRFAGPKVAIVQDEYERTNALAEAIERLGFSAVLTCAPPETVPRIYPPERFANVEFLRVLTGYVPEYADRLGAFALPLRERPITVSYRGRDLGPRFGRLGADKVEIGVRVRAACEARGVACDIAWDEASRMYGDDWFRFLGASRTTLGVESGSNLFDFDGAVERRLNEMTAQGRRPTHEEFRAVAGDLEDPSMNMGQASPRLFEAAVLKTPMILLRGAYSGVVEADRHYIPLEKDYSNLEAVLDRLDNFDELEAMAERAFHDLVSSGRYTYRAFAKGVEALVDRQIAAHAGRQGAPIAGSPPPAADDPTLRERPTKRLIRRDEFLMDKYQREMRAYTAELERLNVAYPAEIARLNEVYPAEITRLNDVYSAEIARLNEVSSAEIRSLGAEIEVLRKQVQDYQAVPGFSPIAALFAKLRRLTR